MHRDYYVSLNNVDVRKSVLLVLGGSGAGPLFEFAKKGFFSTVPSRIIKMSSACHVILISKPGVSFADSVKKTIVCLARLMFLPNTGRNFHSKGRLVPQK